MKDIFQHKAEIVAKERREFNVQGKKICIILSSEREWHSFKNEPGTVQMYFTSNRAEFDEAVRYMERLIEEENKMREDPDYMLRLLEKKARPISGLQNTANNKDSQQFKKYVSQRGDQPRKRTIQKAKTLQESPQKSKKWPLYFLACLAAAGIGIGVYTNLQSREPRPVKEPSTTQIGEIPTLGNTSNSTKQSSGKIDTIDAVEKDFIQKYVQAYNQLNGTKYTANAIKLFTNSLPSVFVLEDGRIVTRGMNPENVRKELSAIGSVGGSTEISQVVQFVYKDENGDTKILGTYSPNGQFVYSGLQLEDLTNPNFNEPNLSALGINNKTATRAFGVAFSNENESKESQDLRIALYNEAVQEEENEKNAKTNSKDDDDGR